MSGTEREREGVRQDKRHNMSLQIAGTYSISPYRERDTVCVRVTERMREKKKSSTYDQKKCILYT